jgi:hypothetical protein
LGVWILHYTWVNMKFSTVCPGRLNVLHNNDHRKKVGLGSSELNVSFFFGNVHLETILLVGT